MLPQPDAEPTVVRFSRGERWTHRVFGLLMAGCLVTAALLYVPLLSGLVGQRDVVKLVHEVCGFALPVPLVVGYALSRSFRADVSRLNRFSPADRAALRWRRGRGDGAALPVGKFNAGQKLNASFTLGAVLVMLATGAILAFPDPFADRVRTGATFTHDWLALLVAVVLAGHMVKALADEGARRGMRTGSVTLSWARREHPAWAAEVQGSTCPRAPSSRSPR